MKAASPLKKMLFFFYRERDLFFIGDLSLDKEKTAPSQREGNQKRNGETLLDLFSLI